MTEQQRPVLLLLIGIVCLSVAPAPAADARKGTVQVEAVVQRYEEDVMWDHFDDDRFAAYDAVTLKMVTPADMANKTIRVYFEFRSIKDNSPMQNPVSAVASTSTRTC